ncbi:MAG: PcfJ domain-containing protein [Fusobacterium varium]|nr:PcfJ domain-containing protein [Fusobacterium varium]
MIIEEKKNNRQIFIEAFKNNQLFLYIIQKMENKFITIYDSLEVTFLDLAKKDKKFFNENIELLKKSPLSFKADGKAIRIKTPYKDYVEMKSYYITGINYCCSKSWSLEYHAKKTFYFYDDFDIKVHMKTPKYILYSFTLKELSEYNSDFQKILNIFFKKYLYFLSKKNLFIKDIFKDFRSNPRKLCVPIDFNLLREARNKRHLLELKTKKTNLYKSFNKFPLNFSYSILAIEKYIDKKEICKLIPYSENEDFLVSGSEKRRIQVFMRSYYATAFSIPFYRIDPIIYDYFRFIKKLKLKLNLKIKSLNGLNKEHDELSLKVASRSRNNKIKFSDNNPFLQLKLPKEFKLITTNAELIEEGIKNRNCVATYLELINSEECIIYTTFYKKERYTIEFGRNGNKFELVQIHGFANSDAPGELIEYIEKCIKDQRIVKKSDLKHEVIGA